MRLLLPLAVFILLGSGCTYHVGNEAREAAREAREAAQEAAREAREAAREVRQIGRAHV